MKHEGGEGVATVCPLVCETALTSGGYVCVYASVIARRGESHRDRLDFSFTRKKKQNTNTSGLSERIFSGLEGQKECNARPPVTVMFHT